MKKLIIQFFAIVFILIMPGLSHAQESESAFPKFAIGLSPSSWISFYAGPQASFDFRLAPKINSANELTYVIGLLDTPGVKFKSGVHFLLKDYGNTAFTFGPNLILQRVKTDIWYGRSLSFSDRANHINVDFYESRIAADLMASVRIDLTKKLVLEFGLGAGVHSTTEKVTNATAANLKSFLTEEPEFTFEELSKSNTIGLLTSFNINFSYAIVQ